ncbi:MAG: molybdopterin-guanine dinucleotide biosynthesis protein B [Gammaproteobacteria bacterium]
MSAPVFGIAGFKNSGKTTLVVDLIGVLTGRGYRVATLKHAHHNFDIDHRGKDSFKHRAAGASEVIVASSKRWAHIRELSDEAEPEMAELLEHFDSPDLVLVEGYKHGTHPKLELRRAGVDAPVLAGVDDRVLAIVSDSQITGAPVPVIARHNVAAIADFILERVGLR